MSKKIKIKKYRKLENIDFEFSPGINLISGTNGTCKTSLLYIVSNSYQKLVKKGLNSDLQNCLTVIQEINNMVNPKIESLTRGDKKFNDPAPNEKGSILNVQYFNDYSLDFRKHISDTSDRFSIKPKYSANSNEKLPNIPIIYLGLSRLVSFGEFQEINIKEIISLLKESIEDSDTLDIIKKTLESKMFGNQIRHIKKNFPEKYIEEINSIYCDFTGVFVRDSKFNKISNIKNRAEFISNKEGVDSNTISAGEDNLYMIITALVSLKYYYESITIEEENDIQSILLIDEIDTTLHPSYQVKLYDLIKEYCNDFKIQFIGTTHSLTLIEHSLNQKDNVIYLIDSIDHVSKLEDNVNFFSIKMFLKEVTALQLNSTKKIPIFTEDAEARIFINKLFDYFYNIEKDSFSQVINHFHLVDANIGSENLINIFSDSVLIKDLTRAICILDGDKNSQLTKNIITLPGKKNPEKLLIDYLIDILNNSEYRDFWQPNNPLVGNYGYQKRVVQSSIIQRYEQIEADIFNNEKQGISNKGVRREKYKKIFNDHRVFFEGLFEYWINDPKNKKDVLQFFSNLYILFRKTSFTYGINPDIWEFDTQKEKPLKVGV